MTLTASWAGADGATIPYKIWDVFTDVPFAGNPLAIVETSGDLTTGQMQTIACEFNLSETIFLMPPADPAHSARARIFFPRAEIPFAGHPTIGAALLLARRAGLSTVTLEEEAGLVPVAIRDGGAQLTAPVTPAPHGGPISPTLCAEALGLSEGQIGLHRAGAFAGAPAFLFVPVRDRDALTRAAPREPAWGALMDAAGVDSAWIYDPDLNARMFSPGAGIPEDPATGSASAILAAQLLANNALPNGTTRHAIRQGGHGPPIPDRIRGGSGGRADHRGPDLGSRRAGRCGPDQNPSVNRRVTPMLAETCPSSKVIGLSAASPWKRS